MAPFTSNIIVCCIILPEAVFTEMFYVPKTKLCSKLVYRKCLILDVRIITVHQCCYCEQLFDTKEELYEHIEVHSDIERNREEQNQKRKKKQVDKD